MNLTSGKKPRLAAATDPMVRRVATAVGEAINPKTARVAATMDYVKSAYYTTRNDALISVPIDRMAGAISIMDPDTFAVTVHAETGAGKSTLLEQHVQDRKEFQPIPDGYGDFLYPVLYVLVSSKATMTDLANDILDAMDYHVTRPKKPSLLFKDVRQQLRLRGTRVIILDDFQHVLDAPKTKGPEHIADSIKNMIQDRKWPIFIVLLGLPEIKNVILYDPKDQLLRRVDDFPLRPLTLVEDGAFVSAVVIELVTQRAKLNLSGDLVENFTERLMFGGRYQFGVIIRIIYHAIQDALEKDKDAVDRQSWEAGYRRLVNASDDPAANVFSNDNWRQMAIPVNRTGPYVPSAKN
ncbi:TniB family NTP-binding protein [Rhizobium sp. BE258]|uniref:TniB family NTP-binding protein n=1 Tax=Rhizobium sp. BE258 TaxID=2817722 RepID=UPI00285C646E|nr:TniB family NTP-binding protein [Rhizobium sp. BE258]MDR7141946.1 hypothetical protein [Rhizobium sp. BE258]